MFFILQIVTDGQSGDVRFALNSIRGVQHSSFPGDEGALKLHAEFNADDLAKDFSEISSAMADAWIVLRKVCMRKASQSLFDMR